MGKKHNTDRLYRDAEIIAELEADFANFETKISNMSANLALCWYKYLYALASDITISSKRVEWLFKLGGLRDKHKLDL